MLQIVLPVKSPVLLNLIGQIIEIVATRFFNRPESKTASFVSYGIPENIGNCISG